MDLTVDPLAERLRTLMANALTPIADDAPEELWDALVGCEALALAAPVATGGYGLGLTSEVVIGTELGRRAFTDLYSGTALAVDALAASGDPRGLASILVAGKWPVLSAGMDRLPGTAGTTGPRVDHGPAGIEVSGTVFLDTTPPPMVGCCFPVTAADGVHLVLLAPERVAWTPGPRGSAELRLNRLRLQDGEIIGSLGDGTPLSDPDGILSRARVRQAAYLLGLAAGAQALAVEHASQRHQFGKPVIEFQAIAFGLAEAAIELRAVYLSIERAAWRADSGDGDPLNAVEVLAYSAETAMKVIRWAVQVHGAAGLTRTSAIHRYYLVARQSTTCLAPPEQLWREAGRRRLSGAGRRT